MTIQTEFEFTLPRGYLDESGQLHRQGTMRLAYASDEIEAVEHPLVQQQPSYLPVILLGRVITRLGTLTEMDQQVVSRLFAADLAYLEDLYLRLNSCEHVTVGAVCPHCQQQLQVQVAPLG